MAITRDDAHVIRFEVIDDSGRVYVKTPARIALSYQDGGRTLKVFVEGSAMDARFTKAAEGMAIGSATDPSSGSSSQARVEEEPTVETMERFKRRARTEATIASNTLNLNGAQVYWLEGKFLCAMVSAWVSGKVESEATLAAVTAERDGLIKTCEFAIREWPNGRKKP